MYTAQYMNQEKMQNVLLGVLMVGLVLVGGGMYLFSTQLQSVATSVKGIQVGMAQLQAVKPVVTEPAVVPAEQQPVFQKVNIGGLTFALPEGWASKGIDANGETLIQVLDPSYKVMIPVDVHLLTPVQAQKCLSGDYCDVLVNTPATTIYTSGQLLPIPSLGTFIVKKGDGLYQVTFNEPVSNEPLPKDLDGVWFPSTSVTSGEFLSFVLTAR